MKVTAAVARGRSDPLVIESLNLSDPGEDEILVKLVASGVCHTDLRAIEVEGLVPKPIVLGHEGAGFVEAVGRGVTKVKPGDAVLLTFDSCGTCLSCSARAPSYCQNLLSRNFSGKKPAGGIPFTDSNGAPVFGNFFGQSSFASHALCRSRNVVKVANSAPLDLLAPLGCGIQTGAGAIIRSLKVGNGQSVAVFGTGSVGLSAIMGARIVGADPIIAIDVHPARLAAARDLGATHVINPTIEDTAARLREITGHGVRYAVDTSGSARSVRTAIDALAPMGVCGVIAATREPEVGIVTRHLMLGGRTIRGIAEGDSVPDEFIPELVDHFANGRLPLERLVTHFEFNQINEAIHQAHDGTVIKPVLRMH